MVSFAAPELLGGARSKANEPAAVGAYVFQRAAGLRTERLADAVGRDDALDRDTLGARLLCRSAFEAGATMWRGIRAVPRAPAAPAVDAADRARAHTPTEAVALVRAELVAAVDRALAGCRRAAVMTGGGVDSSALLGLAVDWARRTGGSAFGVAMDFGGDGDDRPYLRALEQHLGCEIVRVRPEDAASRIDLVRRGVDAAPFTWPGGAVEVEALARARQSGAERVITGVGADVLFDGEPRSLARLVRRGRFFEAFESALALSGFDAPRSRVLSWVVRPLLAGVLPDGLRRARARRGAVLPPWAARRLRAAIERDRVRSVDAALAGKNPDLEALGWYRHQQEIAAGVARRDPFLDERLVETVTSLPPEWLMHGDVRRGLFREAIAGLVPDRLRHRDSKATFEHAFTRFVNAAGGFDALRDLRSATALADLGFVDPRAFAPAFDELAARPIASWGWGDVWPALAVEAFLRSDARRRA